MSKKEKLKKWFKENGYILGLFLGALFLTLALLVPKFVSKNTNIYESNSIKKERIYDDDGDLEMISFDNNFYVEITLNNNMFFKFNEDLWYLENTSLYIIEDKYITINPQVLGAQILRDESSIYNEFLNYGLKDIVFQMDTSNEPIYIDYLEVLTNNNTPLDITYSNGKIDKAFFTQQNKEFYPQAYKIYSLTFDFYYFNDNDTITINFDREANISVINEVYYQGRTDAYNERQKEVDILNDRITDLNNEITSKEQDITRLETQVNMLMQQIEDAKGGYSMADDLFEIADAPITMIQQILNFEILGINLWGFFSAIITIILGVWLIRKLV